MWLIDMDAVQEAGDKTRSLHESTAVPSVSDIVLWLGTVALGVLAWGEWLFESPTPVKICGAVAVYAGLAMVFYRLKHARNQERRSAIELACAERGERGDT